jgi:hypothetical protein
MKSVPLALPAKNSQPRDSPNSVGHSQMLRLRSSASDTWAQIVPWDLSENRRGLAHFAESAEQNVPVPQQTISG